MRISHSELADCQSDPRAWLRARTAAGHARFGFNRALKYAIYAYHKADGRDVPAYLRHLLRNFSNEERKAETEALLLQYIEWAERAGVVVGGCGVRIDLDLGHGITLGGEISRIDIDPSRGEYRGVLLDAPSRGWARQLRMPLIQLAIAEKFERDPSEVAVGFQSIGASRLSIRHFAHRELTVARAEAMRLATVVRRHLR